MVDINLLEKDDPYQSGDNKITPKKETYQNNFEKVSYCISYENQFSYSFWKWLFGLIPHNVYIRYKNSRTPFSYYVVEKKHIVKEVEVYSSNKHKGIPLIIGFKTGESDDFKYYTFTFLSTIGKSTGLPSSDGFTTLELEKRLKEEDTRRNKLKFVTQPKQSQNYFVIEDNNSLPGYIRYEYKAKDDEKYEEHRVSTEILLLKDKLDDTTCIDKLLARLNGCLFNFIYVYYTQTDNIVALIEFDDDSNAKKHFERKDIDGFNWAQNSYKYDYGNVDPILKSIKQGFEQKISYQLDKIKGKYTKNKISLKQSENRPYKYTLYNHVLIESSNIKFTEVLYNKKKVTVVKNEKLSKVNDIISKFDGIYTEIFMYVLNFNKEEHLLIKAKTSKNIYFLYRFGKTGDKWKQLSLEDLMQIGLMNEDQLNIKKKKSETQGLGKLLDEMLNEGKPENITRVLEYINGSINSIIVLPDSRKLYGKKAIEQIICEDGSEKDIPPIDISNNITVEDLTYGGSGSCENINEFKVYMHLLLKAGQEAQSKVKNQPLYLRFYSKNNKISLFNKNDGSPEYLTYSRTATELYVYFHSSIDDPLLLLYNKQAYVPKDKATKNSTWVKAENISDCNSDKNTLKLKLEEIKKELSQRSTQSPDAQPSAGSGGIGPSSLNNQSPGSNEESSQRNKDKVPSEKQQTNGLQASEGPAESSSVGTRAQNGKASGDRALNLNGDENLSSRSSPFPDSSGVKSPVKDPFKTQEPNPVSKPGLADSDSLGESGNQLSGGNGSDHSVDEDLGNGNEGTPGSSDNAFIKFFKGLPKVAAENPALVYGTGSAIGAVTLGSIIGIGVLIYKKCFGVSAAVASVASESL